MSDNYPSRRKFLQFSTATAAIGLAGCQVDQSGRTGNQGPRRTGTQSDTVDQYLGVQAKLGDALDSVVDANHVLSGHKNKIRAMLIGAIATGEAERYATADLPEGWNRAETFEVSPEARRRLSTTAYREHAPADVRELRDAIERYETQRAESERFVAEVAEAGEEIRDYWDQHPDLFDPEGEGAREVPLHSHFTDRAFPLMDSLWLITEKLPVLQREYPDVHDDLSEQSDELLEDCDFEWTEATVKIATGPGKGINFDRHAWIKWTKRRERTCSSMDPEAETSSQQWGFYLASLFTSEIRYDGDRTWTCNSEEWVGSCDNPHFEGMVDEVNKQREEGPPIHWGPIYNCGDWALDKLSYVDSDLASEYGHPMNLGMINLPSRFCDPE